jgi:hypothetical protein
MKHPVRSDFHSEVTEAGVSERSTLFATSATWAARLRARSSVGVALVEGAARGLPFKDGLPDYVRLQNVATAKKLAPFAV